MGVPKDFHEDTAGTLTAWIDESGSHAAKAPGTYILTATVCFSEHITLNRATAQRLLLPGQRKLHWVDESSRRRSTIITTISKLPLEHFIVVRSRPYAAEKPERRRRKCLERLLLTLESLGVETATLESRGPHQDNLDRKMLSHLRTQRVVSTIRIHHATGPSEPMLWLPDACCGAVVDSRCGKPGSFFLIKPQATMIFI